MKRYFISLALLITIFTFLAPKAQAFNPFSIFKILKTINDITKQAKPASTTGITFPFGGKITEAGTACKLHFWMSEPPFFIPHPGIPIPLFGTKIRVGPPGVPASDVFTFPGITQIYDNHHEDKVGSWTLGIALKTNIVKPIIDRINSALRYLTPIIVGPVAFYNFSLACPDGGIITKIGTD